MKELTNWTRSISSLLTVSCVCAALTCSALADTVTLIEGQNGYAGVRDNTIFSESGALSNGHGDHIFAGETGVGDFRRALVRFDLTNAGIPAGSTINNVQLILTVSKTRSFNKTESIYRLTSDWGEGSEDAGGPEGMGTNGVTGTATWTSNFLDQSMWTTAGGDFVAQPSATTLVGVSVGNWSSTQMATDVQNWLDDPSSNFGWILIGDETQDTTAVRFYSSDNNEGAQLSQKPTLIVDFTPPDNLLTLNVDASCPAGGPIMVGWSNATPNATVALIFARNTGHLMIPSGNPCAGTQLGLGTNQAQLVNTFPSGPNGSKTLNAQASGNVCGGYLQLLDISTCRVSNVAQIN